MTQEEKLNTIANRRFKTDYKYLGSEYARSEVLMDYAIDIERELSSKSQECRDFEEGAKQWKATAEWYQKENELLHKQYTELCNRNSDSDSTQDQPNDIESENDRLTAELASLRADYDDQSLKVKRQADHIEVLRAERDKWKEDCIHNANRALEIVAERDKWHVLADEHSATALEFSDSLRDVRAENERLNDEIVKWLKHFDVTSEYKKSLIQQIMDLQKRCEDLEDKNEKLEQYINEMTSNM